MATSTVGSVLAFCFYGAWRGSVAGRLAVLAAWFLALAILSFNAFFSLLLEDGNLLIRGVATLIMSAPLLWLLRRAQRSMPGQEDPREPSAPRR